MNPAGSARARHTTLDSDPWSRWADPWRHGAGSDRRNRLGQKAARDAKRLLRLASPPRDARIVDVGAGNGAVGLAVLALRVDVWALLCDLSLAALQYAQARADELGVGSCARYLLTRAEGLPGVANRSAHTVFIRSTLIHVRDKKRAFAAARRVLKPGGSLCICEPVNSWSYPEPPGTFWGYDATGSGIGDITQKIVAYYDRIFPPGEDPMLDFDAFDLVRLAEKVGFDDIQLHLRAGVSRPPARDWQSFLHTVWNPRCPTLAQAIACVLTPLERKRLEAALRRQVETGNGRRRIAVAYIAARK